MTVAHILHEYSENTIRYRTRYHGWLDRRSGLACSFLRSIFLSILFLNLFCISITNFSCHLFPWLKSFEMTIIGIKVYLLTYSLACYFLLWTWRIWDEYLVYRVLTISHTYLFINRSGGWVVRMSISETVDHGFGSVSCLLISKT